MRRLTFDVFLGQRLSGAQIHWNTMAASPIFLIVRMPLSAVLLLSMELLDGVSFGLIFRALRRER